MWWSFLGCILVEDERLCERSFVYSQVFSVHIPPREFDLSLLADKLLPLIDKHKVNMNLYIWKGAKLGNNCFGKLSLNCDGPACWPEMHAVITTKGLLPLTTNFVVSKDEQGNKNDAYRNSQCSQKQLDLISGILGVPIEEPFLFNFSPSRKDSFFRAIICAASYLTSFMYFKAISYCTPDKFETIEDLALKLNTQVTVVQIVCGDSRIYTKTSHFGNRSSSELLVIRLLDGTWVQAC
jgi:hypothetical protein